MKWDRDSALKSLSVKHVSAKCRWAASAGETHQDRSHTGVRSFMVHCMVGSMQGAAVSDMRLQERDLGPSGCRTFNPHILRSTCPPLAWPWPSTLFCHLSIMVWEVPALPLCDLGLGSSLAVAAVPVGGHLVSGLCVLAQHSPGLSCFENLL